ncbi:hypothetical protein CDAR_553701 [Caerostris darwini]|uniref:Uncharacterized protein n=1 Tax=Caerostris darwini TaxID=1538125 RepID=A0AAV4WJL7_9ARAC|nr:hypothetical protein CDAR_553701 [Caerostris darwini]
MLTAMKDNVKAHDRERKRIARSKPETRARQNALQRERRALKRQQAINPHDDNIKHTKCVQTPSLYSPSCSCIYYYILPTLYILESVSFETELEEKKSPIEVKGNVLKEPRSNKIKKKKKSTLRVS